MPVVDIRAISSLELSGLYPQLSEVLEVGEDSYVETLSSLEWYFFQNPIGQGIYAGAFVDAKLVGVASISPKPMYIEGESVIAAEIGRTMTHKEYRGRGIFSKLVSYLVDEARSRHYAVLYGTPNAASGRIYLGRLGWEPLFHWDRAARPVIWRDNPELPSLAQMAAVVAKPIWDTVFPLRSRDFETTVEPIADPAVADLVTQATMPTVTTINRQPEYLRWRFDQPGVTYHHIHCWRDDGSLVGWAAGRYVTQGQRKRLHLGDWLAAPGRTQLRGLMSGALALARELGATELYLAGRHAGSTPIDRRLGFLKKRSLMPVIGLGVERDVRSLKDWDYREADADMF